MVHYWKETGEIRAGSKRMERDFVTAITLSGVDRRELWPDGGAHESAVAVRVDGIRDFAVGASVESLRDEPHWCTGHADFWWRIFDGELWIDDLKTGRYYPNPEADNERHDPSIEVGANRFPQNPDSDQTKLYALAIAEKLSYTGPVHLSITHWPRLPLVYRHAPPTREWHLTDSEYLRGPFWWQLEALYQAKLQNEVELSHLNPGDWCRFCAARTNCFVAKDFS